MSIHTENEDGQLTPIKVDKSLADLIVESNIQKVVLGKPTSDCVKDIKLLGDTE